MFKKTASGVKHQTVFGGGTKLQGHVESSEDVLLEGELEGELRSAKTVEVARSASVLGNVSGQNVIVAGEVKGDVAGADKVIITASGAVHGNITTSVLSIAPGAVFAGKSAMKSIAHAPEKVTKPIAEEDATS